MPRFSRRGYRRYPRRSFKRRFYKRKYRRHTAKRGRWNRRFSKKFKTTNLRKLYPISGLRTALEYYDYDEIAVTASGDAQYFYRGNSINDPNSTGSGHQPMGHDQFSLMYNRYLVLGSKITLRIWCNKNKDMGIQPIWVGIAPVCDVNAFNPSTAHATDLKENKLFKWKIMETPKGFGDGDIDGVDPRKHVVHLSRYASSAAVFGYKNIDQIDYGALYNANPAVQWFWQLQFQDYDGSSILDSQYTFFWDVHIKYYVRYMERKELGQS